MHSFALI